MKFMITNILIVNQILNQANVSIAAPKGNDMV